MSCYRQGNLVEFEVIFRNKQTKQAMDPDVVTFAYQSGTLVGKDNWTPNGPASVPITYVDATAPAVGTIARTGVGRYSTRISIVGLGGDLAGEWVASGFGQAETWDYIKITPAPF